MMRVRHLYIHVPFCARRCSYCDFSIAVRAVTPVDEYVRALELELWQSGPAEWALDTVYLGGGTPSRLGGDGIGRVLGLVRSAATVAKDAEVTIEVNPDDVTADVARAWVQAGVNRVSLGVQSFHPDVLAWMHRTHTVEQAERAVATLREAGIDNVSADLIFALPANVPRDWTHDVARMVALQVDHVSLYGLTVEPHTPLGRWAERGDVAEASEEAYERDFLFAHDTLVANGFEHYEVSNYARPGRRSRHNSSYWTGVPYAALGPSAHRFDGAVRSWNVAPYAEWVRRLGEGASVVDGMDPLTADNRAAERVYLGLRTSAGLLIEPAEMERVQTWVDAGWAALRDGRVVLTPRGWLRLDALAASLAAL